jgi:hypothetical protein
MLLRFDRLVWRLLHARKVLPQSAVLGDYGLRTNNRRLDIGGLSSDSPRDYEQPLSIIAQKQGSRMVNIALPQRTHCGVIRTQLLKLNGCAVVKQMKAGAPEIPGRAKTGVLTASRIAANVGCGEPEKSMATDIGAVALP